MAFLRLDMKGGLLFLRFLAVGGLNTAFGYACYAGIVLLGATLPFTLILWAGPTAIFQASIAFQGISAVV